MYYPATTRGRATMTKRRWLLGSTALAVATVIAAAACGGKKHGGGGGTPGVTTFIVSDGVTGAPVSGVAIVLADSAGNPVTTVTTNSSGTGTLHVAADRSATVYWTDGAGYFESDTYFHLADGETVRDVVFI